MNKAVFLDRDGTINVEKNYLYRIEDFEFLPGAVDAMRLLQDAGYKLIIVSNQSGIARGFYTEDDFLLLNEWMLTELDRFGITIDRVYYCPHLPNASVEKYSCECDCRKPKLGLFYKAIREFDLSIRDSYAIGDRLRDCAICLTSECKGYLVGRNESKTAIQDVIDHKIHNIKYMKTLYEAALDIMITNKVGSQIGQPSKPQ